MKSNWEDCITSLTAQLEMVNKSLEERHKEVQKYLEENPNCHNKALLLIAEQKAAQNAFQSLEDKIHDMIIYLCRAMTVSKMHSLSNLVGEDSYELE